jgi:hypothetical protein
MSSETSLELQRGLGASLGGLLFGSLLVGILAYGKMKAANAAAMAIGVADVASMAIGLAAIGITVRSLVLRRPALRATSEGLWFGGGGVIPWHDVAAIYVANLQFRGRFGLFSKENAIAFEFHRPRMLLRLPISAWLASPFAVGTIDVSSAHSPEPPNMIVAKLETMRTAAGVQRDRS